TCLSEGAALMTYMTSNPDVWSGWTYWAGGAWWPADYMFLLRPDSFVSPVDKPQMTTLRNNL
ncbi:MAG: glycoside hydrolase family 5 protein, partial [Janthinobacterium lividum]